MIANQVITVSDAVTPIASGGGHPNDPRIIQIIPALTNNCWVGGAGVTTLSGIPLVSTTEPYTIELRHGENLSAISTITNASIRVMATRSGNTTIV